MSEKKDNESKGMSDDELDSALKKLLDTPPMPLKSIKKKRLKKRQPSDDKR
jgi:hypothetical protein